MKTFLNRIAHLERLLRNSDAGDVVLRDEWRALDEQTGKCVGPAPNESLSQGQLEAWQFAKSMIESIPFVQSATTHGD